MRCKDSVGVVEICVCRSDRWWEQLWRRVSLGFQNFLLSLLQVSWAKFNLTSAMGGANLKKPLWYPLPLTLKCGCKITFNYAQCYNRKGYCKKKKKTDLVSEDSNLWKECWNSILKNNELTCFDRSLLWAKQRCSSLLNNRRSWRLKKQVKKINKNGSIHLCWCNQSMRKPQDPRLIC